jgi:hypothetical protein
LADFLKYERDFLLAYLSHKSSALGDVPGNRKPFWPLIGSQKG